MNLPTLELVPFHYKVHCCFSKEQWDEQDELGSEYWNEAFAGHCVSFAGGSCINIYPTDGDLSAAVDTIAHEVSHTMKHFFSHIQEKKPSEEFNAYFSGYIAGWVFREWQKSLPDERELATGTQ